MRALIYCRLGDRSDRSHGSCDVVDVNLGVDLATGSLLWAVTGDVTSLTTLVASLSSGVQGATVGGGAVAGNVTELATRVALHGLSLAIAGKVVRTTALVASSRARTAGETTTAAIGTRVATAAGDGSTSAQSTGTNGVGAGASQVAGLAAVIAASTGASSTEPQSWAVSLDVAKTLTVVALLGLGGAGKGAAVGLVARLLAVVAKTLSRRTDLGVVANVATLVASSAREGRHLGGDKICLNGIEPAVRKKTC